MPDTIFNSANLRKIPLFALLSREDLRALAATMDRVSYEKGDILCRQGELGDSLYTILDGQAEIINALGTPEEQLLFIAQPGDFIGEMALFEPDGVRTATVRAHTAMDTLQLTRDEFNLLIHNQPKLAFEVSRVLSLRMRDANNRLQAKNEELENTLAQLRAAQAELIDKERMERELELARKIQEDILPSEFPQPDNFDLGARMTPAREVGGDFFDFIRLSSHRIGVLIGDVSDKGVPAAIFMALTRSLIHAEAHRSASPAVVLERVNSLLHEMSEAAMFVTGIYGILDCQSGHFEYARAGHELPIVIRRDGTVFEPPRGKGQPLFMFEEPVFDIQAFDLPPGSTVLFYTDGATDSTDPDEGFFGLQRLTETAVANPRRSAQSLCDDIMDRIMAHQAGSRQYDDIMLSAIYTHDTRS